MEGHLQQLKIEIGISRHEDYVKMYWPASQEW